MRRALVVACIVPLVTIACRSETLSPEPSFDGGSDAQGTIDDAGAADAALDDAGAAARDARPDASQWCVTQLSPFCDDFDEDPIAQGWDEVATRGGAIALDDATYTTPARSVLATSGAVAPGGVAFARLAKRVAQITTDLRYAFDVRLDAVDPAAPAVVAAIALANQGGVQFETLDVWLGAGTASVDEYAGDGDGGTTKRAHPFAAIAPGAWTRIGLELALPLDAGLGAGRLTVTVDGAPVVDRAPMLPISQPAFPAVFLGLVVGGPSAPAAVRFDDVTLDFEAL